jgi:hypothetical protein
MQLWEVPMLQLAFQSQPLLKKNSFADSVDIQWNDDLKLKCD